MEEQLEVEIRELSFEICRELLKEQEYDLERAKAVFYGVELGNIREGIQEAAMNLVIEGANMPEQDFVNAYSDLVVCRGVSTFLTENFEKVAAHIAAQADFKRRMEAVARVLEA